MSPTQGRSPAPSSIGILGGGQLARMLALSGYPLGMRFVIVDPDPNAPAHELGRHLAIAYDSPEAIQALADVDVVTYEFENVPESAFTRLPPKLPIYPPPLALGIARDRLLEKSRFRELGIPCAEFLPVATARELEAGLRTLGTPAILKRRTLGYDGKGQYRIDDASDAPAAWNALGNVPCVLEAVVDFERELSLVGVRGLDGTTAFYPLVENVHERGILRTTRAPARAAETLQPVAEDLMRRLLDALGYVGVIAVEFFELRSGLLANEFAPRVHNSGHWTLEGAVTSQFENHLRAVAGLPLGSTEIVCRTVMVNAIGSAPDRARLLALEDVHVHWYAKEQRPGRKLGHVTVCARTGGAPDREIEARVQAVLRLTEPAPGS